ncbi:CDP-glycerol glycerophosphotransferase family protein [Pseudoalteromonas ruthenica]|uniref:CDP-glycerol glycerophosphotransferase family protein n=1 Tax=Pseudoalteromonas ruthenica TaxID=151081 RepID=UPI001247F51E|nr:CDP-glycerol glycerophosphotransferase family protein [Pseudoalteromonas ruthenica]
MKVFFDVLHLYYLPQYLPVIDELNQRGAQTVVVLYKQEDTALNAAAEYAIKAHDLNAHWLQSESQAVAFYRQCGADWVIFGKAFAAIAELNSIVKTALMQHGIGPKACYYDASNNATSVRFVEGQHRLTRLHTLYPDSTFVDTGYAKLDPLLSQPQYPLPSHEDFGLDASKPTVLYAPTFYPSSLERLPKNWLANLTHCNVIIKPHYFSQTKDKYQKHQRLLQRWQQYEHVYVSQLEEFNLVPFMALADVLVSDASSAIFEFFALGKPVVWCNFYKLRWSYRGPFAYRFKARLDDDISYFEPLCFKADSPSDVIRAIEEALHQPQKFHNQQNQTTIERLAGRLDGNSAKRIVSYLYDN